MRKLVSATVSAALCMLSVAPAMAQDYRFTGFDAPRGATATLNLRVPLGTQRRQAQPSYGLTFGYGRTVAAPTLDGRTTTRAVNLADFRFSGRELQSARVASFDLANLDRDRRLSNLNGSVSTVWVIVGAAAVGVGVCLLVLDCFDGNDDDPAT
ncbi:MAG TPA: hypothetical protein VES64_05325 [Allosphingosinicella sp.]|nr:hypothetical protein [Allosphingosinicella sp.]